jgi:hypothetical protein
MHTACAHRPAGRARPSMPRGTLGAGVPPRVPSQPVGAAYSQAERGGARSGAERRLHAPGEIGARCVRWLQRLGSWVYTTPASHRPTKRWGADRRVASSCSGRVARIHPRLCHNGTSRACPAHRS